MTEHTKQGETLARFNATCYLETSQLHSTTTKCLEGLSENGRLIGKTVELVGIEPTTSSLRMTGAFIVIDIVASN